MNKSILNVAFLCFSLFSITFAYNQCSEQLNIFKNSLWNNEIIGNSNISITGDKCIANYIGGVDPYTAQRTSTSISKLSDIGGYEFRFTFKPTYRSDFGPCVLPFVLTSTDFDPMNIYHNMYGFGFVWSSIANNTSNIFGVWTKDSLTTKVTTVTQPNGDSFDPQIGTTFYISIERRSKVSGRLRIFSDSTYTNLIASTCFDIPETLKDLSFIQVSNGSTGGSARLADFEISNLNQYCSLSETASINASKAEIIVGQKTTLTAVTSVLNPQYRWYNVSNLTEPISTDSSFEVSPLSTTDYYLEITSQVDCIKLARIKQTIHVDTNQCHEQLNIIKNSTWSAEINSNSSIEISGDLCVAKYIGGVTPYSPERISTTIKKLSDIGGYEYRFKFKPVYRSDFGPSVVPFVLTSSDFDPMSIYHNMYGIGFIWSSIANNTSNIFGVWTKDSLTTKVTTVTQPNGDKFDPQLGENFYISLERRSQVSGRIRIYSDSNYMNLIASSCFDIPKTIKDLSYIQIGNASTGGTARLADFEVSNMNKYCIPTETASIIASKTEIFVGQKTTLSAVTSVINPQFNWYNSLNPTESIGTESSIDVSPQSTNEYYLVVSSTQDCIKLPIVNQTIYVDTSRLDVSSIGINESFFEIYPNPNNGEFKINTHGVAGEIQVLDILGKTIKTIEIKAFQQAIDIQLDLVSQGTYVVNFKTNLITTNKKVLIE